MSDEFDRTKERLEKNERARLDSYFDDCIKDCKKSVSETIERDKHHSTIVNMCAYAFSEGGPMSSTGYHFITVDPLFKFRTVPGSKIFDVLIYNKETKSAILIECKSSIGNATRDVLKPAKEQIQNAINHKKDLEEEIGGQVVSLEYVVCGLSQDIEEVVKSITNEPLVLWTVDLFRFTLKLFNLKGSVDTSVTAELISKNQLHRDTLLRKMLFGKVESRGQIDGLQVSPTSHICRILSHVFARIIGKILLSDSGQEKRFWLRELREMVQGELLNVTIDDIKRITDEVYKLALKLRIVESESSFSDADIALRLKVGARSYKTLEKEVIDRYSEDQCRIHCREIAVTQYQELLKTRTDSLDHYFGKKNE